MKNYPIGIFDSGIGGLTVWKEIINILPNESVYYYADTANCPYGTKSIEEVIKFADDIVRFFINKNVKLIVVACNTATAAAIDYLRANYDIPFIGMEPAVKPAAISSVTGNIAVLATENTFKGRLFNETSRKYAKDKNLFIQVGYGLVDIVENGNSDTDESMALLHKYIDPLLENNVDRIVLGCTHYPFLEKQIKEIVKDRAEIINPAFAVARQTYNVLKKNNLLAELSNPEYLFFSNGTSSVMRRVLNELNFDKYKIIEI
ncbi:MAG: glutamate racemase [Marinilabiliales bacterium]